MVEFALIVPMMLVIVFGVIDFGRAYSTVVTLANSAREGARYAIISPTDTSGITSHAACASPWGTGSQSSCSINDANYTVSAPTCSPSCTSGNSVSVKVNYNFSFLTPVAALVKLILPSSNMQTTWTLSSTATMRIE